MEKEHTYQEFIDKYDSYRKIVYEEVQLGFGIPGLRLTGIDARALSAKRNWPNDNRQPPNGGWNWQEWSSALRVPYKKYFDVALWQGNQLCGLSLGRLSNKNVNVKLEILEGSTLKSHPLKGQVAMIMLAATEAFGQVAGSKYSLIMDPVLEAIPIYKQYGYSFVPGDKRFPNHLKKEL